MLYLFIIVLCIVIIIVITCYHAKREHFLSQTCENISTPNVPGYTFIRNSNSSIATAKCDTNNGYSGTAAGTYVCRGNYWAPNTTVSGCTSAPIISQNNVSVPAPVSVSVSVPVQSTQSTQFPQSGNGNGNGNGNTSCYNSVHAPPGYGTANPPISQLVNDGWAQGSIVNVTSCTQGYVPSGVPSGIYQCINGNWKSIQAPTGCIPQSGISGMQSMQSMQSDDSGISIQNPNIQFPCDQSTVPHNIGYDWDVVLGGALYKNDASKMFTHFAVPRCSAGYFGNPTNFTYTCNSNIWSQTPNTNALAGCDLPKRAVDNIDQACDKTQIPATVGYDWQIYNGNNLYSSDASKMLSRIAKPVCVSGYIGTPNDVEYICDYSTTRNPNIMWSLMNSNSNLSGCSLNVDQAKLTTIADAAHAAAVSAVSIVNLKNCIPSTPLEMQSTVGCLPIGSVVILFNDAPITNILYTFPLESRISTGYQFNQITGFSVLPNTVLVLYSNVDYSGKETRIIGPVERLPLQSSFQSLYVTTPTSTNICFISDLKNQLPNIDDSDFSYTFSNLQINPLNADGTNVFNAQSNCDITFTSEKNGLGNKMVYNSQYSQWGGCKITSTDQCNSINAQSVNIKLNPQPLVIFILYGKTAPFKYYTSSYNLDNLQNDVSRLIASIPITWQVNSYEIKSMLNDSISLTLTTVKGDNIVLKGPTNGSTQLQQILTIQDIAQVSTTISQHKLIYDVLDAPTLASKYSLGSTNEFLVYDTCNTVKTGTNTNDLSISNEKYNLCANPMGKQIASHYIAPHPITDPPVLVQHNLNTPTPDATPIPNATSFNSYVANPWTTPATPDIAGSYTSAVLKDTIVVTMRNATVGAAAGTNTKYLAAIQYTKSNVFIIGSDSFTFDPIGKTLKSSTDQWNRV